MKVTCNLRNLVVSAGEDGEVDETSAVELFEEKLKDVIDMTTQKRWVLIDLLSHVDSEMSGMK